MPYLDHERKYRQKAMEKQTQNEPGTTNQIHLIPV